MKAPVLSSPETAAPNKEMNQVTMYDVSPLNSPLDQNVNGAMFKETERTSSDSAQYIKSGEGLSDPMETTAKSSSCSDLTNIVKISSSSDPGGCVHSDESCVPLFDASSATVANDSDIDCFRLGIVPENLVASLFEDDNAVSGINVEQSPATEPQKGFVASDHPDASNWFYQDPQGVIQGNSD